MITIENAVFEYHTENATVRIHEGKLTAEERKAVLEEAGREFFKAILKAKQHKQALSKGGEFSGGKTNVHQKNC